MAACPRLCAAQTIRFSSFKAMPPTVGTMPLNIMMSKTFQISSSFNSNYVFSLFWHWKYSPILKREVICYDFSDYWVNSAVALLTLRWFLGIFVRLLLRENKKSPQNSVKLEYGNKWFTIFLHIKKLFWSGCFSSGGPLGNGFRKSEL